MNKKPETYPFKDDHGKIHKLTWQQMMEADQFGFTTINGVLMRRVRDYSNETTHHVGSRPEIVSDALGFPQQQIGEMQEHLRQSGCKGIEFERDKAVPEFVQVKAGSHREFHKYMRSRGFHDQNSRNGSGAMLTKKDFDDAAELSLRSTKKNA